MRPVTKKRSAFRGRKIAFPGLVLAVLGVGFALYVNTLGHSFVFDDTTLIVQNPQVTELQWAQIWGGHGYRPLRTSSYAVNYAIGGLDPFGYHLFNVVLHALNSVLACLLFLRLSGSKAVAMAGALVFASHPAQTAAVAYVSGRKDLMAAFFVVMASLLYVEFRRRNRRSLLAAAIAAFVLGMLSKEVAIVLPLLLILIDALMHRLGKAEAANRGSRLPLPEPILRAPFTYLSFAVLGACALYYSVFVVQASRMQGLWGGDLRSHVGTSFKLFAHYLRLSVFPHPLVADYSGDVLRPAQGLTEAATWFSVVAMLAFVAGAMWLFARAPLLGFGMLWFLITLVPVLQFIPFHEIAADHFLYLPLVGLSLAVGWIFRLLVLRTGLDVVGWSLFGALVIVLSVITIDRNRDWKDPRTLWEATYAVAPGSYRANTNLGILYYTGGDWERAVEMTERAIKLGPDEPLPHANLGAILRERGFRSYVRGDLRTAKALEGEAVKHLLKAIELDSGNPFTISNLGDCYKDLALIADEEKDGNRAAESRDEAKRLFRWAMKVGSDNPEFPLIWYKYGSVMVDGGDCQGALPYLKNAADRLRHRFQVQFQAGYCSFVENMHEDSIRYFQRAFDVWPAGEGASLQLEEAFLFLGESYEARDDLEAALRTFTRMLTIFPDSARGHLRAGATLYKAGRASEALRQLEQASSLASDKSLKAEIERWLKLVRPRTSSF